MPEGASKQRFIVVYDEGSLGDNPVAAYVVPRGNFDEEAYHRLEHNAGWFGFTVREVTPAGAADVQAIAQELSESCGASIETDRVQCADDI